MRAVDTNVLVRLLARDDLAQTAAAEAFVADGAWVPLLVLAEASWVLSSVYEVQRRDLGTVVEMLLGHRSLVLEDAQVVAEALTMFRERPKLSFSDCLILEVARSAGHLPLGTFDRGLSQAPGAQHLGRRGAG
ncbi:MAG: type II toxin-antitoxin system VapC family toxin [Deltaproteobacteria bacterium]|jgi:predicted nucleic-acid-binding protein|nr:type II toxin-antitoxin system VapC family toxin [Deltaproteobacteria bacterium]